MTSAHWIAVARIVLLVFLGVAGTAQAAKKQPFELLHQFEEAIDGRGGGGNITLGADGRIYGVNPYGGPYGGGTFYATDSRGNFSLLHSFLGPDGFEPVGRPVQSKDGYLYGLTSTGSGVGTGCGGIFRWSPIDGAFRPVFGFKGDANGCHPSGSLAQDSEGRLYGTMSQGGTYGLGTVFRWDPRDGTVKTLHHFSRTEGDGGYPLYGVTLAADASTLYGVTYLGGLSDRGVIFRVGLDGNDYQIVRSFDELLGSGPSGQLVLAKDGSLYGASQLADYAGAIYRVSPEGEALVHYAFTSTGPEGLHPVGRLAAGNHGVLYGTTSSGGPNNEGVVFALNQGQMQVVYAFGHLDENGWNPFGGIVRTDGYLYVETGNRGYPLPKPGTIFRVHKPASASDEMPR